MGYKIKVTRVVREKETAKEWKQVADTGNKRDNGPVYACVKVPRMVTREVDMLVQEVETLDLVAVIKVVNGIA